MKRFRLLLSIGLLLALVAPAFGYIWPILPNDSIQPLGNNWGNYQNYGGGGYFHNGIDIITPSRHYAPVAAVAHGWVKGWGTISGNSHYRLAISDSGMSFTGRAPGWLYAHIDRNRSHKNQGDEVFAGDTIGYLCYWPVDSFDHIHFARISDTGALWNRFPNYTWWFIQNPLTVLEPSGDLAAPVFENARSGRLFAFCNNNTSTYQDADSLVGAVDIVAKIYDKTGYTTTNPEWDKLAPFRIEHMIRRADGLVVRPWTLSLEFSNTLFSNLVSVVYKRDATCRSQGDYDDRDYYYVVTNTDGDSIIESGDVNGTWNTHEVNDDDYWVVLRAQDHIGNTTLDSMLVTTVNGVGVEDLPPLALSRPLRIFPNPGPGPVSISFGLGKPAAARLRVIDAAGRVVFARDDSRLTPGPHEYVLRDLRAGVYFVELLLNGSPVGSGKLVVTR